MLKATKKESILFCTKSILLTLVETEGLEPATSRM